MNYNKISDTSKFVTYLRSYSDICLASEIYAEIVKVDPSDNQRDAGLKYRDFHWLAPIVEARFKSISEFLKARKFPVIIELASGFSGRFFDINVTKEAIFFDTDLESLMEIKKIVLAKASKQQMLPASVQVRALDVMSTQSWSEIKSEIGSNGPIAIVNEGLCQYFNRQELEFVARQVYEMLSSQGGVWVTPDFSTEDQYSRYYEYSAAMKELSKARTKATGRRIDDFAFKNHVEICNFFSRIGFQVERQAMLVKQIVLSSAKKLQVDEDEIVKFFGPHLNLWILKVEKKT